MKKVLENQGLFLAEKERFELSRRGNRPTPLAGAPLRPLEYFSVYSCASGRCSNLRHRLLYTIFILLSTLFLSFFKSFFIDVFFALNPLTHARQLYIIDSMIFCKPLPFVRDIKTKKRYFYETNAPKT